MQSEILPTFVCGQEIGLFEAAPSAVYHICEWAKLPKYTGCSEPQLFVCLICILFSHGQPQIWDSDSGKK